MSEKSSECPYCDISFAVLNGDIVIVKELCDSGLDLSVECECNTALFDAMESQRFDIAEVFLRSGADPNQTHPWTNEKPIEWAIQNLDRKWVDFLLAKGALVDDQYLSRLIARSDHPESIRLALNTGIDPNALSEDWLRSPLHVACMYGHVETVKVLIEGGAKLSVRDKNGSSPMDLAVLNGHGEVTEYIASILPE